MSSFSYFVYLFFAVHKIWIIIARTWWFGLHIIRFPSLCSCPWFGCHSHSTFTIIIWIFFSSLLYFTLFVVFIFILLLLLHRSVFHLELAIVWYFFAVLKFKSKIKIENKTKFHFKKKNWKKDSTKQRKLYKFCLHRKKLTFTRFAFYYSSGIQIHKQRNSQKKMKISGKKHFAHNLFLYVRPRKRKF